jgi:CubicO group peptidase (beta-lactamase class C family)
VIEQAIAERVFPGAVVYAGDVEQVQVQASFGTTMYADPGSVPVTRNTIYDIASLTKVFTAMAVLCLHDAHEVDLARPAAFYLPALRAREVTIWHLLTHTSGLDLRLSVLRERGAVGIRAAIAACVPLHPPGSVVAYTNVNSTVLGDLVAAVTGRTLDQALAELIILPLQMEQTCFNPPAAWRAQIAPTEWDHHWRQELVHGQVHDESAAALGGVAGHAGLFSRADDLVRLMQCWLAGGAWAGRQILREATVAWALQNHTAHLRTPSGQLLPTGLGWMRDRPSIMGDAPTGSFGHTGFTGPVMIGIPQTRRFFVLLSNRTYPQRTPPPFPHHRVTAALLHALGYG